LSLIRQVIAQPKADLYRLLASLQHKEFLYEQPALPESDYLFKHALTQDVAYSSVLIERRKVLHEQTAQAIEQLYHDKLDEQYDELAHHYQRSGNTEKAIEYLHKAGQQAVQRSANEEAIRHLTLALDLLKTLPDTPERVRQELTVHIILGVSLHVARGAAAPEVERVYTRARELCQQIGDTSQLFQVLVGLGVLYMVRGELRTALEIDQQIFSLAQKTQDPMLLLHAHRSLGPSLFWLGEFTSAQAHLEEAIALYNPQQLNSYTFFSGFDPGVASLSLASHTLWHLGYPDQALQKSHQAVTLAQELAHPHSVAFALAFASRSHRFRGERDATRERAEALLALTTEHGFAQWKAYALLYLGGVLTEQGQLEEGVAQTRQGLVALRTTGAELGRTYYLAWMAQALGKAGQLEEGLSLLADALAVVDKSGERHYEAELYRLKGELLLMQAEQMSDRAIA
jgi:predicted ATPase